MKTFSLMKRLQRKFGNVLSAEVLITLKSFVNRKRYYRDLLERSIATGIQAAIGLLLLSPVLSFSVIKAALVVGVMAMLSVVKCGLARLTGDKDSCSLVKHKEEEKWIK